MTRGRFATWTLTAALLAGGAVGAPVFRQVRNVGPVAQDVATGSLTIQPGNSLVIAGAWDSVAPTLDCTDSAGGVYKQVAPSVTIQGNNVHQQVLVAAAIDAGVAPLQVRCTATGTASMQFVAVEYEGLDSSAPVLMAVTANGASGTPFDAGVVTTAEADALLVSWTICLGNRATAVDPTFTVRSTQDGDLLQDRVVASPGAYSADVDVGAAGWAHTLVAFRAALSDAGAADAGRPDSGASDGGSSDSGTSDAGTSDSGTSDAGTSDAGTSDAGTSDAGSPDAGVGGERSLTVGCDCSAIAGERLLLAAVALLAARRRR